MPTEATAFIEDFLRSDSTLALLEGPAGTGKTTAVVDFLKTRGVATALAAPTHKALRVLCAKLACAGVPVSYDFSGTSGVQASTTAKLLGIAPIIGDTQDTEVRFASVGSSALLLAMHARLLVIDEASMLGWPELERVWEKLQHRAKILLVGDRAQLPPVKKKAIPFGDIKARLHLSTPWRQAAGSGILQLANYVAEEGKLPTRRNGEGVTYVNELLGAFSLLESPAQEEHQRAVYIAYRNCTVDYAQERICRELLGHSAKVVRDGEYVLSEANVYEGKRLLCANQEEFRVVRVREDRSSATLLSVDMQRVNGESVSIGYLPGEIGADHPYAVELGSRLERAQKLEQRKRAGERVDEERRAAWREYFFWRDQTCVRLRHPFALTAHKAQGSTYHTVYADVGDLARGGKAALYVAVSRPSHRLILQKGSV